MIWPRRLQIQKSTCVWLVMISDDLHQGASPGGHSLTVADRGLQGTALLQHSLAASREFLVVMVRSASDLGPDIQLSLLVGLPG